MVALGILEQIQIQGKIPSLLELEHNSAEYLHALIEALRCVLVIKSLDSWSFTSLLFSLAFAGEIIVWLTCVSQLTGSRHTVLRD